MTVLYSCPIKVKTPSASTAINLTPAPLPQQFLCQSATEGDWRIERYQVQVLHKEFAQPLNVVIVLKTHLKTQQQGHVILFSSDWTLNHDKLIELYSLRFQIEFNFRDAKQFWGLEDFMNISQTAVTNAVNLAFFMVSLSHRLLGDFRRDHHPDFSILDLKAFYRAFKYVEEVIKLLPQKPEPFLSSRILTQVANLGAIHPVPLEKISPWLGQGSKNWSALFKTPLTSITFSELLLAKVLK